MIRDKFYRDISNTIDNHPRFDSSDFKIEPSKGQNGAVNLTIRFGIEPKYKIFFKIPNSTTTEKDGYRSYYVFSGTVCPGPLAFDETFSFQGEEGVFERITTWLNCIWEELSSNPIVKKVESQQQQIDEIFEKFEDVKDDFFTVDEASELKKRLDELEETLKAQIQQSTEDKKVYEQEVYKLHTDIDTLKQTINSFNKKGWIKSFTSKVFKWTKNSDNRKMLADGYKVVKEFLPEHLKSSLPE
jgi:hypothetical protein